MFSGGRVFVNHASGFMSTNNQVHINSTETIKEKLTFERDSQSQGVLINGYRADNDLLQPSIFPLSKCHLL